MQTCVKLAACRLQPVYYVIPALTVLNGETCKGRYHLALDGVNCKLIGLFTVIAFVNSQVKLMWGLEGRRLRGPRGQSDALFAIVVVTAVRSLRHVLVLRVFTRVFASYAHFPRHLPH